MNKKELRKKLEELYLEGLEKKIWTINGDGKYEVDDYYISGHFLSSIEELEVDIYGDCLSDDEMRRKKAFINVKKRWEELKNSPLYKTLE